MRSVTYRRCRANCIATGINCRAASVERKVCRTTRERPKIRTRTAHRARSGAPTARCSTINIVAAVGDRADAIPVSVIDNNGIAKCYRAWIQLVDAAAAVAAASDVAGEGAIRNGRRATPAVNAAAAAKAAAAGTVAREGAVADVQCAAAYFDTATAKTEAEAAVNSAVAGEGAVGNVQRAAAYQDAAATVLTSAAAVARRDVAREGAVGDAQRAAAHKDAAAAVDGGIDVAVPNCDAGNVHRKCSGDVKDAIQSAAINDGAARARASQS